MMVARIFPVDRRDEHRWRGFHLAMARQYGRLGAGNITNHPEPSEDIQLIVAEVFPGRPVAGVRLHANRAGTRTPVEAALDDPAVLSWVAMKKSAPSAELSGFWTDYQPGGLGLGSTVWQAAVAYGAHLGYLELFAFCHEGIEKLNESVGMTRVPDLPVYKYPNAQRRSTIRHLAFAEHRVAETMRMRLAEMTKLFGANGCVHWISEACRDAPAFSGRDGPALSMSVSVREPSQRSGFGHHPMPSNSGASNKARKN